MTTALLSVSDKTGIVDFARALHQRGVRLLSTGGTAKLLAKSELPVTEVAEVTGFPEMLDGRVKTLHPRIHGGLLARRELPAHMQALQEHGIAPIDLVVVNLYPFEETLRRPGATHEELVEKIDIGGPAMVRAAAKNHARVTVVVDPAVKSTCRCLETLACPRPVASSRSVTVRSPPFRAWRMSSRDGSARALKRSAMCRSCSGVRCRPAMRSGIAPLPGIGVPQ